MEFNNLRENIANTTLSLDLLLDTLEELYGQTKQITPLYIRELSERIFASEMNTIRYAASAEGLSREEALCAHTADRELKAILVRGGLAWIESVNKLAIDITSEQSAVRRLKLLFTKKISTEGIRALMGSSIQTSTSANATVATATRCSQSERVDASIFIEHLTSILRIKARMSESLIITLDHCRATYETNTRAQLTKMINTLSVCIPSVRKIK